MVVIPTRNLVLVMNTLCFYDIRQQHQIYCWYIKGFLCELVVYHINLSQADGKKIKQRDHLTHTIAEMSIYWSANTLNPRPHPHRYQFYGSLLLNDNVIGSATSESGPEMSYQQGTDTFKNQIALFYNPTNSKRIVHDLRTKCRAHFYSFSVLSQLMLTSREKFKAICVNCNSH